MPHISSVPFCWNPTLYWESNRPMQSYSHFANTISWSRKQHWRCCPYNGGNEYQVAGIRDLQTTTHNWGGGALCSGPKYTVHSSGWLYSRCIRYQTREKVKPIGAQQVAVWDRLWLYIWINTTHPEPSCSSSTNVHLWRWVLARMFWLLNIITDVDADKIPQFASCTGAGFWFNLRAADSICIFTATVQGFWLACPSIDIVEATNYSELAPWHGVVHHQYHIRRVYLGLP